jgi:hypothetical protein
MANTSLRSSLTISSCRRLSPGNWSTRRAVGTASTAFCVVSTRGIVTIANMSDAEYEMFHELTSTSPSMDDGEAATIAVAAARDLLPVIDEKRGRARASILMKARVPGWSLDLFRHPTAIALLGDHSAVQALYLALRDGRMRIPSESANDVIALIGMERSRECICLPGYRERFLNAHNEVAGVKSGDIAMRL